MKDSTRAYLTGMAILAPFFLGFIPLMWFGQLNVTFMGKLSLLLPALVGLILTYLAYRRDQRVKHYFRESMRSIREFDDNYCYEPEGSV